MDVSKSTQTQPHIMQSCLSKCARCRWVLGSEKLSRPGPDHLPILLHMLLGPGHLVAPAAEHHRLEAIASRLEAIASSIIIFRHR